MVFSSPVFLFLFLPACLAVALVATWIDRLLARRRSTEAAIPAAPETTAPTAPAPLSPSPAASIAKSLDGTPAPEPVPHPVQNVVLLLFSLAFYVYGEGWHLLIMMAAVATAWVSTLLMDVVKRRGLVLASALAVQLGVLGYFKYANFFVAQVTSAASLFGVKLPKWGAVVLPVGISFFIFHCISYTVDVYRRERPPRRNFLSLTLYIILFPQLIAGPIVRYAKVASQLDKRAASLNDMAGGATRFIYGLFKKVIIADAVAQVADAAFALPNHDVTTSAALIGAFAYTLQIYFDFSAYSDMAIGLGHIFGFRFPENFNRPLTATSITDFWRRWHMTLSSCFRDYVYVPLGGNRGSNVATYRNLWIVFLLSGLWHGASWTFVAWGAFHGFWLTVERMLGVKPDTGPSWRRATTFVLVVIGFTLFRADTFTQAMAFYKAIFVPAHWALPIGVRAALTHKNVLVYALAALSLLLPLSFVTGRFLEESRSSGATVLRFVVMTAFALYAACAVASSNFSPFIYFRF